MGDNGFSEYKIWFLEQFQDIKKNIEKLQRYQVQTTIEIERLKIRASLWGAAAGGIPVLAYILIKEFSDN